LRINLSLGHTTQLTRQALDDPIDIVIEPRHTGSTKPPKGKADTMADRYY